MRLAVSRAAAPEMSLSRLVELAKERGLDGVEVKLSELEEARALPTGRVVGLRAGTLAEVASVETAKAAASLGAPVVAPRGAVPAAAVRELGALYAREGARLLLSHATSALEAAELVEAITDADAASVGLAWDVAPKTDDLREGPGILLAATGMLGYIHMRGGGPELADEDAVGTGELVTSIALSGFGGVVTLHPSTDDRGEDWDRWLHGKIKNGCGTAYEKKAKLSDIVLDIRPVEPRFRLDTIMGAYHALAAGKTLHVTFDHDPSCMFYMLQATEPEGSFEFVKKDDGPEIWRADVTKRTP